MSEKNIDGLPSLPCKAKIAYLGSGRTEDVLVWAYIEGEGALVSTPSNNETWLLKNTEVIKPCEDSAIEPSAIFARIQDC